MNLKDRLLARQEELRRLIDGHHSDTRPVELDQTAVGRLSRMDDLQTQAMSIERERRRKDEIIRIKSALERINQDEYGYCVNCGKEIDSQRIEFDPAIPTCVDCAK